MTNKPVWLLDIDGVINACPANGKFPETFPEDTWHKVDGIALGQKWPIRYSTAVIDRINELSEQVEVRWHTTWQHDAPGLGELLGLNVFPVAWDYMEYKRNSRHTYMEPEEFDWWKMIHAVDVVNLEHRPLIWTDDDIDSYSRGTFKRATIQVAQLATCLVTPALDTGLTQEDLDYIGEFVSENESR